MTQSSTFGPVARLRAGGYRDADPSHPGSFFNRPASISYNGPPLWEHFVEKSDYPRRPKPQGIDIILSMTNYFVRSHRSTLSLSSDNLGNVWVSNTPYASTAYAPNSTLTRADASARMKTLSGIKSETWNLSTFLGELPETVTYVSEVAKSLVQSYRDVKRGDMRSLRKRVWPTRSGPRGTSRSTLEYVHSGPMASKWMEWRYAIQPMMYDVEDALKALYDSHTRPLISKQQGRGKEKATVSMADANNYYECAEETRCLYTVYFQVNPDVDGFKKLGLLNPVATLWELAPLSFVLDWFLPMGDYLANLDAMAGVSVMASCSSYQTKVMAESQNKHPYLSPGYAVSSSKATTIDKYYGRTTPADLSVPLPTFGLGLNARRVIDGISLLRLGLKSST